MDEKNDIHIGPRAMKYYVDRHLTPVAESLGLKPTYGPFLMAVLENEGLSMKTMTETLIVDKALTTRVIGTLIGKGFVEDRNADSRGYSLYLTQKGRDAADKLKNAMKEVWGELLADLTDEERECLKVIHSKIEKKLRDAVKQR